MLFGVICGTLKMAQSENGFCLAKMDCMAHAVVADSVITLTVVFGSGAVETAVNYGNLFDFVF